VRSAADRVTMNLTVNGDAVDVDAEPGETLLEVLRERLNLRGSKEACGRGECGACTVLHGDDAIASCVMLAALVTHPVRTIEALAPGCGELRAKLADLGGTQCGFCTPGHVVRAAGLDWGRIKSQDDLRHEIAGNICRCTGYVGLVEAIWACRPLVGGTEPEHGERGET
jgi:aerobic-type carbon monoxide dehydrogenase small subunit (CoxS/CutS family)